MTKRPVVRFMTPLDMRVHPSPPEGCRPGLCYELTSPLRAMLGATELIEIPIGFYSDGGSVPRFAQSLIGVYPTTPSFTRSFFLHDFLYMTNFRNDRELCDGILLEGALNDFSKPAKAYAVWSGVRLGGWVAWDRYIKENKKYRLHTQLVSMKPIVMKLTVNNWARNLDGLS